MAHFDHVSTEPAPSAAHACGRIQTRSRAEACRNFAGAAERSVAVQRATPTPGIRAKYEVAVSSSNALASFCSKQQPSACQACHPSRGFSHGKPKTGSFLCHPVGALVASATQPLTTPCSQSRHVCSQSRPDLRAVRRDKPSRTTNRP